MDGGEKTREPRQEIAKRAARYGRRTIENPQRGR